MRTRCHLVIALLTFSAFANNSALAEQVPFPKTAAEVPGPASGTAMTTIGRMAYLCG